MTFHRFGCAELTGRPEGIPVDDAVSAVAIKVRPALNLELSGTVAVFTRAPAPTGILPLDWTK
ncbi:hypothetical protein ABZT02_35400 [Streptomyces sp. NPDC005402]|uniref:hypothetical protein n=1 Tax=Streptomyces sp. NPDC005402 TaxID=3155338 RepID=UPI0033AC39F1